MLAILEPHFEQVILTSFESERAESSERLFELANHPNKKHVDDWQELLDQIKKDKLNKKVTFIVGSLDLVGKVRVYIKLISFLFMVISILNIVYISTYTI